MRLFISINFDEQTKQKIKEKQDILKKYSSSGNFTKKDNLHITLVFLGEIESKQLSKIKNIMAEIKLPSFYINITKYGMFKHNNNIFWLEISKNNILNNLYLELYNKLTDAGFNIEFRKFVPHLTIVRELKIKDTINGHSISNIIDELNSKYQDKIVLKVNKFSLMNSERINGKLTYTELFNQKLE